MANGLEAELIEPQRAGNGEGAERLLREGKTLTRVQTGYQTAVAVQKPRNIDKVVAALDRECEYAGESFYYSMAFGGSRVEGGSIGLAYAIAREWGNCALVVDDVRSDDESWTFYPTFIDLEKGVNVQRAFRQRKEGAVRGRFDSERKQDITFQIGQSKASRNVVFAGVPRWLVDRCIDKAKDAVAKKITPEGLQAAAEKCAASFRTLRVSEERLVAKVGKPRAEWTSRDIADLRGDYQAIKSGEMSAGELFPEPDAKPEPGPVSVDGVLEGKVKPTAVPKDKKSEQVQERGGKKDGKDLF